MTQTSSVEQLFAPGGLSFLYIFMRLYEIIHDLLASIELPFKSLTHLHYISQIKGGVY